MTAGVPATSLGARGCGVESYNPLRDQLIDAGQERLALGVERHHLINLDAVYDMLNGPYGWADADLSSPTAAIRSAIRILDEYDYDAPDVDLL